MRHTNWKTALGDYNGDGITTPDSNPGSVDSADFVVWQYYQSHLTDPNRFRADGDDDGKLNDDDNLDGIDDDYAVWAANFGDTLNLSGVTTI